MSRRSRPSEPDFNLTPQGVLIKTSNSPDTIRFFNQKMAGYEQQLRSMDPDYAYSVALGKIQRVVDGVQAAQRPPISCKAGCSACCHQKVDLGPFEEELIRKHLAEHPVTIDRQRLDRQNEALKEGRFEQLPFDERRCVFLSEAQTCSIYQVRPLMCRRHFVQSDPVICRSEDLSQLQMDVNPDADAYLSAYVTRNSTRSLPACVATFPGASDEAAS